MEQSASVTSIFEDLGLGVGNRYVSHVSERFESDVLMWTTVCFDLGVYSSQCNVPASCNYYREDFRAEMDVLNYYSVLWDHYSGTGPLPLKD